MKALPDLSAIIGKRLSGSSSDVPSRTPHGVDRRESPPAVIRPSPVPDSVGSEPSREILEIAAEVRQNEPPQKKKKKHAEKDPVPSVGAENRELVVHEESNSNAVASPSSVDRGSDGRDHSKTPEGRREAGVSQSITATTPRSTPSAPGGSSTRKKGPVKFPDHVEFKYDGDTPLAYDPEECAELVHQIRGGAKDMPPVKDLIFKDAYVDAARTKVLSDGSLNYVVELYDTALKGTISKLKNTERLVRVNNSALDLKTSEFKAVIEKAETEHSRLLAEKKAQKAKFTEKFGELKGKFKTAGEKIRVLEREKASLEEEKAAWEKEKAATALRHLKEFNRLRDSRSYEVTLERVRVQTEMIAKCNRHFNNIREREAHRDDLDTASSQGEPSAERSAVPLVEGSTAPPVLPSSDPGSAPLGASSMVDEEAPDPVLPAEGRETRPGLDDLVELSDSSIERSGQNESSDGAPPGVGED
ncbi:hypothetical protein Bca52824_075261 [Brassica carinata]|uniref:Uncharacterized protein n=1 Tax=Brassica carinata TaxID=52824 RepID=A0A8X7PRU7_BRACI|nr:hypothetical protein Bca52824_075261 [Brassica carinata]